MVLILAAAAAALFVKSIINVRRDPARAEHMSDGVKGVVIATTAEAMVNLVGRAMAALLKSLWSTPVAAGASTTPLGNRRFGEPVGEAA